MRLLFIRHGDPDYVNDTLTEKGHKEAMLLAGIADRLDLGTCFVSPLGRARDTASYSLEKTGKEGTVLNWLAEFSARVDLNLSEELQKAYGDCKKFNGKYIPRIPWDVLPSYWTAHPEYVHGEEWRNSEIARCSDMAEVYDSVTKEFDNFLAEHGYVRDGLRYKVLRESKETVTFFCHFAITCVFLSHLWNVSPFVLWHSLVLAPTSVSEIVTEEREKGCAYFRAAKLGDQSHLFIAGEKPSFAARFCEVFSDKGHRH